MPSKNKVFFCMKEQTFSFYSTGKTEKKSNKRNYDKRVRCISRSFRFSNVFIFRVSLYKTS